MPPTLEPVESFPQPGIYYHTDAAGRRWRIHVRRREIDRRALNAELEVIEADLAAGEPTQAELLEYAHEHYPRILIDDATLEARRQEILKALG